MTQKRPPVVAVMGHVDHGKTTLLDYIRKISYQNRAASKGGEPRSVAERETGGITQAIGAYEIEHKGERITIIDTPGHEAFSSMRHCGAGLADLAILVVAADDGVKPQTKDALACIREAKIPFVVAINKTDMAGANVDRTKNDLAQAGVYLEGMGGDVSWQAISAKTGAGIPELLDLILLVASVQELSFDPDAVASGIVMTARLDHQRGIIAGVILRNGTLAINAAIGTKAASGKIKVLENAVGVRVDRLIPSAPALVFGFQAMPCVGEPFFASENAEAVAAALKALPKDAEPAQCIPAVEPPENALPIVLKADEAGSLTALEGIVRKISSPEMPFMVVQSGVGDVHETDIKTCGSTGAALVGFKIKVDKAAQNLAQAKHIAVITSSIIYELEDELKKHAIRTVVRDLPTITLLKTFNVSDMKQQIIGGKVTRGPVKNQSAFSVLRGGVSIGSGKIVNLQSGRKDAATVEAEQEVGLLVSATVGLKPGDVLEFV